MFLVGSSTLIKGGNYASQDQFPILFNSILKGGISQLLRGAFSPQTAQDIQRINLPFEHPNDSLIWTSEASGRF